MTNTMNCYLCWGGGSRLIDWLLPVGTVRSFVSDVDPNKIYSSQTWVRFAMGQTLVGVDEEDIDFKPDKSGGEKVHKLTVNEMPSHQGHFFKSGENNGKYLPSSSMSTYGNAARGWYVPSPGEYLPTTTNYGSSQPHNNLQPYTTVYYWKRIA